MREAYRIILEHIRKKENGQMRIAIDGRCASGKTTLAALLQKETDAVVFHMDDFFLRPDQRTKERLMQPGGNVDYERFTQEVLRPLERGGTFSWRPFSCKEMALSDPVSVTPGRLVIVEGSYSCHPALWDFYDLRVFLSVDPKEQLARIRKRNGEEALVNFKNRWIPLEEQYFKAYRIRERCELAFEMR